MNTQHKLNLKVNRVKRLTNKLKEKPLDDKKSTRKQELVYELNQAGIKID